jgi:hypothetical protein
MKAPSVCVYREGRIILPQDSTHLKTPVLCQHPNPYGLATRYDKRAIVYRAAALLAAVITWLQTGWSDSPDQAILTRFRAINVPLR